MIVARAPGKVVLWGEYAVLAGAPALVMAVDRYARCAITPASGRSDWNFTIQGLPAPGDQVGRKRLLEAREPPRDRVWHLVWHVLQGVERRATLPAGGDMVLDTHSFFADGHKLGLGSSAALCVATYTAACRLLDARPALATALGIHQAIQGGQGSGLDVAAAWHGGTLRFQHDPRSACPATRAWPLPPGWHTAFVWAGVPARTTDHLSRFRHWCAAGATAPLDALAAAAGALFEAPDLTSLSDYATALRTLDRAAGLGIYSDRHEHLERLAKDAGVVYKPCGAGGGDVGAAFTRDPEAAARFLRRAADDHFLPIPLEAAPHGFEVTG